MVLKSKSRTMFPFEEDFQNSKRMKMSISSEFFFFPAFDQGFLIDLYYKLLIICY